MARCLVNLLGQLRFAQDSRLRRQQLLRKACISDIGLQDAPIWQAPLLIQCMVIRRDCLLLIISTPHPYYHAGAYPCCRSGVTAVLPRRLLVGLIHFHAAHCRPLYLLDLSAPHLMSLIA